MRAFRKWGTLALAAGYWSVVLAVLSSVGLAVIAWPLALVLLVVGFFYALTE